MTLSTQRMISEFPQIVKHVEKEDNLILRQIHS